MDQIKIDRINELAKKHREMGLTPAEEAERHTLRQEYIAGFRRSLVGQLENTYVVDEAGNKRKLSPRQDEGSDVA